MFTEVFQKSPCIVFIKFKSGQTKFTNKMFSFCITITTDSLWNYTSNCLTKIPVFFLQVYYKIMFLQWRFTNDKMVFYFLAHTVLDLFVLVHFCLVN